ncbi:MAG: DUF1223 domain-containing protein [Pseudomonadota bacterium]
MISRISLLAAAMAALVAGQAVAAGPTCKADSPTSLVPVIELYTSEGCSSCPPADRWLSTLKQTAASGRAVVQAFHVGYWDYIGWVDRFASPAYAQRQRDIAARNGLSNIYTPQLVRNGRDFKDYAQAIAGGEPARARIALHRTADDAFEATVSPVDGVGAWSAYWTVTENGHSSKVKAGENAGELLQHDFVVRQYVAAGDYRGESKLTLRTIPPLAGHPRQVNLVVFDPKSGRPLQALGLGC